MADPPIELLDNEESVIGFMRLAISASSLCSKAAKRMGAEVGHANEESVLCSANWKKEIWDKKLHCPGKIISLHCAALESIYDVFEGGRQQAVYSATVGIFPIFTCRPVPMCTAAYAICRKGLPLVALLILRNNWVNQ